ncbi:MAG: ABC transporter ATP-binding protein [Clostridia bacterium]|nr:ABC transporter ATP-binding protein [Clostridia bacterium]MBQ5439285.1 ABC transporter ATP-binding protein [Clostridia bacterium]
MIRKLSRSVREYLGASFLAPLFVVGEVILEVIIPMLMAQLIDFGINTKNMDNIFKTGVQLIAACLLSLLCGALAGAFAAKASAGFAKNLRHDMFYNVQSFSFSNIDKFSTSSLVTRLTTDVTNVQNAYQMIVRAAFRSPCMIVFSLIMAFRINKTISTFYLLAVPVLGLAFLFIFSNAHPIFEKVFKTYDKLNNIVGENLHGIRVVKAYVREDHEDEKFKNVSGEIYDLFIRAEKIIIFNMPVMQLVIYTCMIMLSWFSAKFIVASGNNPNLGLTTGQLTSLYSYLMQMLINLMMLSMIFLTIVISKASAERICEVLDEKSDLTDGEKMHTKVKDGSVVFENVSFSYNGSDKYCLSDVDIQINSGEVIGVIGGTGSSKSSLVQLIPRLYDATKGRVLVGGEDVRDYKLDTLRNEVAMVLQKNVLFSGTIKENLRWGNPDATDEELVRVCKLAQADDFIEKLPYKYDTYIEQGGTNVSGGQKQRLCIARALLKKPKILILDDSTSAVDTKTDALIRKAFAEEIPDTTKFIIAQRVSSVEDADKIIVLDGGKVNGFGTHKELLKTNAIYREVYESQVKGGKADE